MIIFSQQEDVQTFTTAKTSPHGCLAAFRWLKVSCLVEYVFIYIHNHFLSLNPLRGGQLLKSLLTKKEKRKAANKLEIS